MFTGFILGLFMMPEFFNILPFDEAIFIITLVLTINSFYIYKLLTYFITFIFNKLDDSIEVESNIYAIKNKAEKVKEV